jgi:hypothetical protein
MSEIGGSREKSQTISRRGLIKAAASAVGIAALAAGEKFRKSSLSLQENQEKITPFELTVAALRFPEGMDTGNRELGKKMIEQIEHLLQQGPVNLVVTPEFSFELPSERKADGMPYKPRLVLTTIENQFQFEVDSRSDSRLRFYVTKARELSEKYDTHIMLSSFAEDGDFGTMLHIAEGKIVGRKRKFFEPEGHFSIKTNGQELSILPIFCDEIWENTDVSSFATPFAWAKNNSPYDILVISAKESDFDPLPLLAAIQKHSAQGTSEPSATQLAWDMFNRHFEYYLPLLNPNALIVYAHPHVSGIFRQDLQPIEKYSQQPQSTLATIHL